MGIIEIQGVNWLSQVVAESNFLEPAFTYNDRTLSWDGTIFVYEEKVTKKNFIGRIPVQIKSEKVMELSFDRISFPFEVSDLKNYSRDGGVILFVVQIIDLYQKRVFFSSLLPSDIRALLSSCKPDQFKKSVVLHELDVYALPDLEVVCKDFLIHRKLQYNLNDLPVYNKADLHEFMLTGVSLEQSLDKSILSKPQYLYGKKNQDDITYVFIDKINIIEYVERINRKIVINGHIFYENYQVVHKKEENIILFGEGVSWNLRTNKISNSFHGSLASQINDINFLLALFHLHYFNIGDQRINTSLEDDGFISQIKERLSIISDVKALMDIFQINPNDLDLDQIDDTSNLLLTAFIDLMVYHKKETIIELPTGIKRVRIGNIYLGVNISQRDQEGLKVEDLFNQTERFQYLLSDENGNGLISPYILLDKEFLLGVNNLNLDVIVEGITGVQYSNIYGDYTTQFILELIHSYDETNNYDFLKSAMDINDWLSQNDMQAKHHVINKYQIIIRTRELTLGEKEDLNSMKPELNYMQVCGVSILLENKSDFQINFNKLTSEEKEVFCKYPIYTLAQNLRLTT